MLGHRGAVPAEFANRPKVIWTSSKCDGKPSEVINYSHFL